MALNRHNALHGHVSEDTAYVVDDYPYGYRHRTTIRYWIETTKHGDRFCSQTLNPKTGRWNKPKKSTYVHIACMYVEDEPGDDFGHVKWNGIGLYTKPDARATFLAAIGDLTIAQKYRLAEIRGLERAMEDVTFRIHEGERTPEEEQQQARVENVIRHRIVRETDNALTEIEKNGP